MPEVRLAFTLQRGGGGGGGGGVGVEEYIHFTSADVLD